MNHLTYEQIQALKASLPPLGTVLSEEWTTQRWRDAYIPIPIWKSVLGWILGNGWHRTRYEFQEIMPGDPDYDPTPYKRIHIV